MEKKTPIAKGTEAFMWRGIVALVFAFILQADFIKTGFGKGYEIVQKGDWILCGIFFIMGGKSTLQLLGRVLKSFEDIKKGEDEK